MFGAGIRKIKARLNTALNGPQAMAFLPALTLAGFWIGGEPLMVAAALFLPLLILFVVDAPQNAAPAANARPVPDLIGLTDARALASQAMGRAYHSAQSTACIIIEIDGLGPVNGPDASLRANNLRDCFLKRLRENTRPNDICTRIGDDRYLVLLEPTHKLDLEALLQFSSRLQSALEVPVNFEDGTHFFAASIGFCSSKRLPSSASGETLLENALIALDKACSNGPSAIRTWSESMRESHLEHKTLLSEVRRALETGQIQPWFQPQVCTSTGEITGVEALSRWIHPERGIVPPDQFLRCLDDAGQMSHLNEVVLQHALTALRSWDRSGINVPRVSINLSANELRDPRLADRISWEVDRFGLVCQRLGIEVQETVITSETDTVIARNLDTLTEMGCFLDLDDFGTGAASIMTPKRFKVNRLKIDRSFVTRIDRSEEQRQMLTAVLGMADRLNLETLAEGVETVGEHALLAQLGCGHVQGFGIARPMPADKLVDWAHEHESRIADARRLGSGT